MTKEILADRIKQLISVTQELLLDAIKLRELYDKYIPTVPKKYNQYKTSEIPTMIRFLHCSFFYDALLNLNTSLNPPKTIIIKRSNQYLNL